MRNFWIESQVDGRMHPLRGGPARKDGGMTTKLYVKSNGLSRTAVRIDCYPTATGLVVEVENTDCQVVSRQVFTPSGEVL